MTAKRSMNSFTIGARVYLWCPVGTRQGQTCKDIITTNQACKASSGSYVLIGRYSFKLVMVLRFSIIGIGDIVNSEYYMTLYRTSYKPLTRSYFEAIIR